MWSTTRIAILSVVLSCVGVGIGVIIGYFSHPNNGAPIPTEDTTISAKLMNEISAENMKENLRDLTKRPHIAGRDVDEIGLVELIKQRWNEDGLDAVSVYPYDVLLSYPKQNDSNYVAVLNEDGTESDVSQRKELVIDPEQNDPDVVDPFNAYSAAGEPEGDLVYVNYATIEDFIELNRTLKIDTVGKICISRYGSIFRGDKAKHAQQYGCSGLILYSDPKGYTVPWAGVYPDSYFLPSTGAQRGTLWVDDGDPRTPNYPSIDSAWHTPDDKLKEILPKIPVTPIGYIDAVKYLEKMTGDEVKEEWKGGLNITYRYGPGFKNPHQNKKLKMYVQTKNEEATIHNVIGYIRGSVEPDRYVLLGNHRDAWVFGAIDPSSGTAALLEIVRAFGEMVKQGWRPRRTLMFCSWGAEEYGLIGSTEWVEQLQKELQARAVAYLNVDASIIGNHSITSGGVSSLRDVVFEATKLVQNPDAAEMAAGRRTVYDTWNLRRKDSSGNYPQFSPLGSGSDFTPFLQNIGVASVDLYYTYDTTIGLLYYPLYHTIYETFEMMTTYIDPDFTFHRAVGQTWAEVGRRLADSVILPIDCRLYASYLEANRDSLKQGYGEDMTNHTIDLAVLDDAINVFSAAAQNIHQRIDTIDTNSALEVRAFNDQLMQLERAFIGQNPLQGRVSYRHVISAPSLHDTYGNTAFPGLTDSMFDIDADPDQEGRWDEVRRQYSIVVFHILSAAATLDPVVPSL